jgi:hypothetical protein
MKKITMGASKVRVSIEGGFTQVRQAGELFEGAQNDWAQLPKGLHTHLRQPESTQAWWDEIQEIIHGFSWMKRNPIWLALVCYWHQITTGGSCVKVEWQ